MVAFHSNGIWDPTFQLDEAIFVFRVGDVFQMHES